MMNNLIVALGLIVVVLVVCFFAYAQVTTEIIKSKDRKIKSLMKAKSRNI